MWHHPERVRKVEGREVSGAASQSPAGRGLGEQQGDWFLLPSSLLSVGNFGATSLIYIIMTPVPGSGPRDNCEGGHQ